MSAIQNLVKRDIQEWFRKNCNEYYRTEPVHILPLHFTPYTSRENVYELDQIANEMGHVVIILHPCHWKCKPIELVRADVKGEVTQHTNTLRLSDVERLVNEVTDSR